MPDSLDHTIRCAERRRIECMNESTAKAFKIPLVASNGLRSLIRELIAQADDRQPTMQGGRFNAGALIQHLVGAKLDLTLGAGLIAHHGFSRADGPKGQAGDFLVDDVAIHVTTSPGEAVIERCRENLDHGFRPVLVTTQRGATVAEALAHDQGISDRIDIFEIEQFIALNLYKLGRFAGTGRQVAVYDLIERYNAIVDEIEADPSLRIELHRSREA